MEPPWFANIFDRPIDDLDSLAMVEVARKGVPALMCKTIADRLGISMADLGSFLNISSRTLTRYPKANKALPKSLSDHLIQIVRTIICAEEVFEDEEKARRWLLKSCRALGDHRPLDLLDTITGARLVENELGRIEWGVYS